MADHSSLQLREQDLSGKTAVITGASKGIGRATALNLASRGCSILGTCSTAPSLELLDALNDEVEALYQKHSNVSPPKIHGLAASIRSEDHHMVVANAIEEHFDAHVDIYINNAAAVERTPVGHLQASNIAAMCFGNIQSPAMTVDELVKRKLFRKNSRIIFVSSCETTRCDPSALLYGATKAANEAMARTYAAAFGGHHPEFDFMAGTTANSVMVGLTETAWTKNGAVSQEVLDAFKEYWHPRQCIPGMAQPEDVADVIGMLCSREARWITASKVCADGGAVKII